MKNLLLFTSIFILGIVSCKKEESAKEILTSRNWKVTKWYENEYDVTKPCVTDNTYQFFNDGSFKLLTNDNICFVGEPAVYDGTWEITPDQKRMNLIYPEHNFTYNIISLNTSRLEVQYQYDTSTTRIIYSKK